MPDPMLVLVMMLVILALLVIVPIMILFIRFAPGELTGYKGYYYKKSTATEESPLSPLKITKTEEYQQGKTWWDWQQLLPIPFALVLVTAGFSWGQNVHSEMLAKDQQQQMTLVTYMDQMSGLLLNSSSTTKLLHDSKKTDEVRNVAIARTLIALSSLDPERKRAVLLFLYQADLITWHHWPKTSGFDFPIINLFSADLKEADLGGIYLKNASLQRTFLNNAHMSNTTLTGADLESAELSGADLSGASLDGSYLMQADLSGANLSHAQLQVFKQTRTSKLPPGTQPVTNLSGTILIGANLSDADLSGANLSGANLSDADLSGANLSSADLKGATMPDGSKHP
jgi:uncharacterized protein YjbI with pentapeptide repeats